jgi:hypothetical protein
MVRQILPNNNESATRIFSQKFYHLNEARFIWFQRIGSTRYPASRPVRAFFSARARRFSVLSAAAQNFIVSSVENAAAFCLRELVTASDGGFLCVSQWLTWKCGDLGVFYTEVPVSQYKTCFTMAYRTKELAPCRGGVCRSSVTSEATS